MTEADVKRLAEIRAFCEEECYEDGDIAFLLRLLAEARRAALEEAADIVEFGSYLPTRDPTQELAAKIRALINMSSVPGAARAKIEDEMA